MKNTIKITLALALFCGVALADDGNQGTGGRSCNPLVDPACSTAPTQNDGQNDQAGTISISGIVLGVIQKTTLFLLG